MTFQGIEPLTVLIVEDSPAVRAVLSMSLRIAKFPIRRILEAYNGKEGLDTMRTHQVDLVFTDINMPEMRGDEMVGRMKRDPCLKEIPVIVICYHESSTPTDELKAKGVDHILPKPFTPEMLHKAIRAVLSRTGRLGQGAHPTDLPS